MEKTAPNGRRWSKSRKLRQRPTEIRRSPAETASIPPRHNVRTARKGEGRAAVAGAGRHPARDLCRRGLRLSPHRRLRRFRAGRAPRCQRPRARCDRAPARSGDNSPRTPEVVRAPETPRIETPRIETPRVATAPTLRPLPPPITVSTPAGEPLDQGRRRGPPYAANTAKRSAPPDAAGRHPAEPPASTCAPRSPSHGEHTSVAKTCCRRRSRWFQRRPGRNK